MSQAKLKKILKKAVEGRQNAYAPYSHFKVGAAFEWGTSIFSGCNIENASYGATICAERSAIVSALSQTPARNKREMKDLVVVTDLETPVTPCGLCLQVISEFAKPDLRIHLANTQKIVKTVLLSDLMPYRFTKTSRGFASTTSKTPNRKPQRAPR
jgi:homotetrameric cytidine deaminase